MAISSTGGGATPEIREQRLVDALILAGGDQSKLPLISQRKVNSGLKRVTFFGNSFVAQVTGFVKIFQLKAGDLIELKNAGIGGNSSQDMLDRLDDIPAETELVMVYESNNDTGNSPEVTAEQHAANIKGILTELQAKGFPIIYLLGSPADDDVRSSKLHHFRLWDWVTCKNMGIPCFDIWTQFANNDGSGAWASGISDDGVHPTRSTYKIGGASLAEKYKARNYDYPMIFKNGESVLPNALMTVDTDADGIPDSWSRSGDGALTIATSSLGVGNTATLTISNLQLWLRSEVMMLDTSKKWAMAIRLQCEFSRWVHGEVEVFLRGETLEDRFYLLDECSVDLDPCTLYKEFAPIDATGYRLYVTIRGTDFDGSVSIAQPTIFCIDDYTVPEGATYAVNGDVRTLEG